jgi:predicted nucleic acid-binding protein
MVKQVIVDASPLIGLALVEGLIWLPQLFGQIFVPESVKQEVLPGKSAPGEQALAHAFDSGWLTVWHESITPHLDIDLDTGETDCINIALSSPQNYLLIMDERAGRAVAKEYQLHVAGTAAVIGQAKKQGLISSARATFEILHRSDFRISATVINKILASVGE